jgi:hypothetical protein
LSEQLTDALELKSVVRSSRSRRCCATQQIPMQPAFRKELGDFLDISAVPEWLTEECAPTGCCVLPENELCHV